MNGRRSTLPHQQNIEQREERGPRGRKRSWTPLSIWYRISLPNAELEDTQQEVLQKSRLGSILLLICFITSFAFLPAALTSTDLHVLPPLIGLFVITCMAIPLNKMGKVTLVGLMIVAAVDLALIYSLLSYPAFTLTQNALPIYDMFVLSDIIAVSLLPLRNLFFVSTFHSIFMCADIALQPHTPDLQQLLTETNYSLMIRPLTIQIVVTMVIYLWVRNTTKAVERANRAEIVVLLEREIAQQKRDLDEGIQQLQQTLVQAANGDLKVRVPLVRENMLWQVDVALNTLLARLQRSNQSEQELKKIKLELERLIRSMREAKAKQTMIHILPAGTQLDQLESELLGCYLIQAPTHNGFPGRERY